MFFLEFILRNLVLDDIYLKKGNNKLSFPTGSHQTDTSVNGQKMFQAGDN